MRVYALTLAVGLGLTAGFFSQHALAELLVYEGFDYTVGEILTDQDGGFGFNSPWTNATTSGTEILAGSLTGPAGLPTTGNHAHFSGADGELRIFRNFGNIVGADGDQTWMSLLGQRVGPEQDPIPEGAPWTNNPYSRSANVQLQDAQAGQPQRLAIGNPSSVVNNEWSIFAEGSDANNAQSGTTFDTLAWAVMLINHHGDNTVADDAYLWINPDPTGAEPTIGTADASLVGLFDYSGVDSIRPFMGQERTEATFLQPHAEMLVDEIRIGTTWADLSSEPPDPLVLGDTDGDGIPEPEDLTPIRMNYLTAQTLRTAGDLTGDSFVDFADFRQWKTAILSGGGSLADVDLSFLSVPEPSAAFLAFLGMSVLAAGRPTRRCRA